MNRPLRPFAGGLALCLPGAFLLMAPGASAATLPVGPGQPYSLPCQAITAAHDGDTIEIDAAGTYVGDRCYIRANNLTIKGVNGRAHLLPPSNGWALDGKGLWNIDGQNTTIENIEISGVRQPSNGAAIRMEGQNLTLRNCYFHDNNDGILTNELNIGDILIEYSEFDHNGAGDGLTHNIYINKANSFTLRYCYSHNSHQGHLVKSRALVNYILYNHLADESGDGSYELDIPVGGTTYVIGNVIEQGPNSPNRTIITYGEESIYSWGALNPGTDLYVINNTIVNDETQGTFINIAALVPTPAVIQNNIFAGPGMLTNQASAVLRTNLIGVDPQFVNALAGDYELQPTSPAINNGSLPPATPNFSLLAMSQHVHATCSADRVFIGLPDIGAYEYGDPANNVNCGAGPVPGITPTLMLPASAIPSGGSATVMVGLSQAAPAGGADVYLAATNSQVTVPARTTVPAGQLSTPVTFQAAYVATTTHLDISATYAGKSASVPVTIAPGATTLGGLSMTDYNSGTFTAQLTGPAPAGGITLQISVSNPAALSAPAAITIPQGGLKASFQVLPTQIQTATSGMVTMSYQGVTKSAAANYKAYGSPYFTLNGSTMKANSSRHGNYGISAPAPTTGFTAVLTSSNPAVLRVPATFSLPPGQHYSWFEIDTGAVSQATVVTVTATYAGITSSATVTVNP